jgi:hypothetical protein
MPSDLVNVERIMTEEDAAEASTNLWQGNGDQTESTQQFAP